MGYTKIIQYGNITEVYEYEKNISDTRRRSLSEIERKRARTRRASRQYTRTARSIRESRARFFRLVHHNNVEAYSKGISISFLTITYASPCLYAQAARYNARFFEKIKKRFPGVSYISVPEKTKKGRWHFHVLMYGLPPKEVERERDTRNFQRSFERGYIDLCLASTVTSGLAGYLAKYMGKALGSAETEKTRGYAASRNIKKIRSSGGNSIDQYVDMIVDNSLEIEKHMYDTVYLGRCVYKKYENETYANP